jgi:hypothetical protein
MATTVPVVGFMARRVPGRPAADQQHEIGILQERLDARAQMQRMVLWEIRKDGAPTDRDAEEIGELDQCREGRGIAAGGVGQDHRVQIWFENLFPAARRQPSLENR